MAEQAKNTKANAEKNFKSSRMPGKETIGVIADFKREGNFSTSVFEGLLGGGPGERFYFKAGVWFSGNISGNRDFVSLRNVCWTAILKTKFCLESCFLCFLCFFYA